jgi:type II secretory pathway pseudopilin PulG
MIDRCSHHEYGFTYLGVLILVAIIGVIAAATLQLGAITQRRAAEEELLEIGGEFREAFLSYANATTAGQQRFPPNLQELLKDSRFPNLHRHLRRLYVDPLSGKEEWGTIKAQTGPGIIGVYSLADGKPIKIGNFDLRFQDFKDKTSYRDWKFMLPPEATDPVAGLPKVGNGNGGSPTAK